MGYQSSILIGMHWRRSAASAILASIVLVFPQSTFGKIQRVLNLLSLAAKMGRRVDSVFINKEVCEAYSFLLERNGTGTRGTECYKSQTDRILKLNPEFAVGLYRALTEIEKLYGGKNIIQSGFRCTPDPHSKGCAADIIWTSCQRDTMGFPDPWRCSSDDYDKRTDTWMTPEQKWIDENGKNAPYKIHLRLRKAPEGHHVEPVDTQGCTTGPTVESGGSGTTPLSGLSDAVRRAFGMPTQQAQPAVSQPAIPSQPAYSSQSPLSSYQEPHITSGNTSGVSSQISSGSGGTTNGTSIADTLERLAFGIKATTSIGTATSVPLVVSGSDAAGITSSQDQGGQQTIASTIGSIPSQQTFISGDLSWQSESSFSAPLSGWEAILVTLKAALLRILQYLQPFGSRSTDVYDEFEE